MRTPKWTDFGPSSDPRQHLARSWSAERARLGRWHSPQIAPAAPPVPETNKNGGDAGTLLSCVCGATCPRGFILVDEISVILLTFWDTIRT